jgi:hypothetical protein
VVGLYLQMDVAKVKDSLDESSAFRFIPRR